MRKIETQLEDDLTGGPAEETVMFGIDGRSYEIDLNAQHAADLRRQLGRFADHARQVHPQRGRTTRTAASRERSRQIRAWAEQHGIEISAHGRLPGHVIQQYESERGEAARPAGRRAGGRRGTPAGQPRAQASGPSGRGHRRLGRPPTDQAERRGARRPRLRRGRRLAAPAADSAVRSLAAS